LKATRKDIDEKLAQMRTFLRPRLQKLPSSFPEVVLFFSVSDGPARARVVSGSGKSLEAAWQNGLAALRATMKTKKLKGRWVRVDWVDQVEPTTWAGLKILLKSTKRNYFRLGVALDNRFKFAFTEMELNANAMLYGGTTVNHAVVNEKNFHAYARSKYRDLSADLFRDDGEVFVFSTQGVFCDEDGELHELNGTGLDGGRRRVERLTPAHVLPLISSASDYLARQVNEDGSFVYGYHPCFDRRIDTYNALRHASTTYSMVEAWEVTRDDRLKAAIDRSLAYLCGRLIQHRRLPDGSKAAFLVDLNAEIKLGANAVAILALTKYSAVTGTDIYLRVAEKLANGICFMQDQENGSFAHVLNYPDLSIKERFRTIYYEGEAAFGLMRLYELTQDPRLLETVEKAFDHFIANDHWKHHDHWLSYCVNELTHYRPDERYYRFGIRNFASYLDFVIERITTFPTLLELMMAAERMIMRIQEQPDYRHLLDEIDLEKFYRALHKRAHYLLNGHFWPEFAMYYRKPDRIVGSFFIRHHAFRVRIDDVEHYLSGFVAYRKFLQQDRTPALAGDMSTDTKSDSSETCFSVEEEQQRRKVRSDSSKVTIGAN